MLRFLHVCTTLAADNLRNGTGRAVYLVITLAVTTAAWLLLAALAAPFIGGTTGKGSGIHIRNGNQSSPALPLSYARRIEAIRGARDVSWTGLQMVGCGNGGQVTINAVGGPGAASSMSQHKVEAPLIKRWQADPLGVVITRATASKCGWHDGQGIAPKSLIGTTGAIALHIVAVVPGSETVAFAHFDYINRIGPLEGKNRVVSYSANAANPRDNDALAARIEAAFAHDFPTLTATTNATTQSAWARFGKVQQLLAFVMAAILLCAASVLVSVWAHAAAQRKPKFAVLQVLGFPRETLFSAVALELLATVVVGALLGIGLSRLVGHELALTFFGQISNGVQIPRWAWWGLPAWLAALAVIALAWPAGLIARVRPAHYRAI